MKILVISSQALFPETHLGGAKRLYYLAHELNKLTELHLISLDGNRQRPSPSALQGEFARHLFLPLKTPGPAWGKIFFPPGIEKVLARNNPAIEKFLGDHHFDATLLAFPFSLCFLKKKWAAKMGKLVYLEDDLLLESYKKSLREDKSWSARFFKFIRLRQAESFFKKRLESVHTFICISPEEEKIVRRTFPRISTRILKYGVPLEEYPFLPDAPEKNVFGFIGNYRNPPNLDALSWLAEEIFPFVSAHIPNARLILAGGSIPENVKARYASNPSIQLWDNVDDIGRFYRAIGIFLNPLRQGRGLRTKVVEAAAFGRPVVSTSLGGEGLEEMHLNLCETKEQFLAAILSLQKPVEYQRVREHNRRVVESGFSISRLGGELKKILEK